MRIPFSFMAPSAPAVTVISIDAPIGDTRGGATRRIVGSGFTGATASDVLWASTASPSIVVVDDNNIDAVVPAHAAATVDVSVFGVALSMAFTFWNLAIPGLPTKAVQGPDYGLGGAAGVGQWIRSHGIASVPYTTSNAFVSANVPESPDVDAEGVPIFNRSGAQPYRLLHQGGSGHAYTGLEYLTWVDLIDSNTANECTIAMVLDIASVNSSSATEYEGDGICLDDNFRGHVLLSKSTAPAVLRWYWYEGAFRKIEITLPSATGRVVAILKRFSGAPAHWCWSLDGGTTWTPSNVGSQTSGMSAGSGATRLGFAPGAGSGFAGRIKALSFYKFGFTTQDCADFKAWADAEHP